MGSEADHIRSYERQTGKVFEGGTPEAVYPVAVGHVWEWFLELVPRRTSNGMGPNPITFADIQAWAALTERAPTPQEVRWLMRLDDTMLHALHERSKA
jgi:hypothetical protein